MNAATQTENTALATLPPAARAALALGSTKTELALRELIKASAGILEVKNKAGREECHAAYMKLKNSRVAVDHAETDATEDAKKFTKAVKTEAARLVAIITDEEKRLLELRDAYDKVEQDRKDAEVAAEMARVALIAEHIEDIRKIPLSVAGKPAAEIQMAVDQVTEIVITEAIFGEQNYQDQATAVRADALAKLETMLADRIAAEAAEAQRLADIAAEDRRRAAEAEELARQRAENERIAAENAAAAKKLADQQAALEQAAREQREKLEATARTEKAERDRVAADLVRQMAAQQAQLAADRQALADERAAEDKRRADALATEQLAARVQVDHGDALAMNAQFDVDVAAAAALVLLQPAPAAASAPIAEPLAVLADAYVEPELTSFQIAHFVIDAVMAEFQMDRDAAIERLSSIDFTAYKVQAVAA
jgi:hypothetical protein